MKDYINKIKNYLIKKYKLILFLIIFAISCFIYNLDNQNINYILKRGVILEYGISQNTTINEEKLKSELLKLNVKYSNIDIEDEKEYGAVDSDNQLIEKTLRIALASKANEKSIQLFNSISDYVFENYPNSKLIELRSLNDNYSTRYLGLINGLIVVLVSFFIWVIVLQLFLRKENFIKTIIDNVIAFFKKCKLETLNLLKKTKEKGFFYLLKRILLDDNKDDENTDITKEVINTILFVVVFVIVIRFFIGELRWIPSGSMRPTILEHDRVFVEKLDYPKKPIQRGDILVFYPPETQLESNPIAVIARLTGIFCKDIAYIKRVVGMPNDKFEIKQDDFSNEYRVYINDDPLNEPYISSKVNWTECTEDMFCGPFKIPEGNYFMMGDNRNNSQDSRFWGFLDKNRIIGRANFMFFPISRINILKDKYLILHKEKQNNGYIEKSYILNRYEFLYKI